MSDMIIKLSMLVVFFGVMIFIGLYCRRHATDVSGFVLGGRSVGPWLTAFAYGTSATRCWAPCWPGPYWDAAPAS